MSKKLYVLIVIILVIAVTFMIFFVGKVENNSNVNDRSLNSETKISESTVTIELTPSKLDDKNFYVDISVSTHSVDLSKFDLKKLVKLEFDGEYLFPVSAPKLEGHHSSGALVFDVGELPNNFKIKIEEIPDLPIRIFEW